MNLFISGMGWVTPLGSGIAEVWQRLRQGEEAQAEMVSDPVAKKFYPAFRIPAAALKEMPVHARLRRASAISRFAAAAGTSALHDAGLTNDALKDVRIALIFAISNGGVIYTKRFYHDIVVSGAGAASPLLFPETVFNAPASHLAAILGITGRSYTLVGDGAVGIAAMQMAEDLMQNESLDYCLVVGAEEVDWLLCDAYAKWRLLRSAPPVEPFQRPAKGMVLSEGAGAVLIGRAGTVKIEMTHGGAYYSNRNCLAGAATKLLRDLKAPQDSTIISSANGTFIDHAEAKAVSEVHPDALVYTVKPALGESVGASCSWQLIIGAQSLSTQALPPLLHVRPSPALRFPTGETGVLSARQVIILSCGLSQQLGALRLST
jgi:3-oxoacyl-(acyl-carrier-protein) synthase